MKDEQFSFGSWARRIDLVRTKKHNDHIDMRRITYRRCGFGWYLLVEGRKQRESYRHAQFVTQFMLGIPDLTRARQGNKQRVIAVQ